MTTSKTIRLGIIGAGIFARDSHVPALLDLPELFDVVAVYSRTESSAAALNALLPHPADLYTDLDALLRREDIDAVDVVLPINPMPEVVARAFDAGKHVISEKPIAPTVAAGRELMARHAAHPDLVWMVAENWRYEDAFIQAGEIIRRGDIGKPFLSHWSFYGASRPESSKYYKTEWRRANDFPGGFLLDGGIHHMAAIRLVLGEVSSVSAAAILLKPDIPPIDTVSASLRFANGAIGTYGVTYAIRAPWDQGIAVVGEEGMVRADRLWLEVTRGVNTERQPIRCKSLQAEFTAFARAITDQQPHRNTPPEALRDLAFLQAILNSAEARKWLDVEKI